MVIKMSTVFSKRIWRRLPQLDKFGNKIIYSNGLDTGRILDAYGYFHYNGDVHDYSLVEKGVEYSITVSDINPEVWAEDLKPLLCDEGFKKESEIIEELMKCNECSIILTDYYSAGRSIKAYLSLPLSINHNYLFKLIGMGTIRPSIEFIMIEGFPTIIRYSIKINRQLHMIFRDYGVKKTDMIKMSTVL